MDEGFRKVIRSYVKLILGDRNYDPEHIETGARMLDYLADVAEEGGGLPREQLEKSLTQWAEWWTLEDFDEHEFNELLDVLDEYCNI